MPEMLWRNLEHVLTVKNQNVPTYLSIDDISSIPATTNKTNSFDILLSPPVTDKITGHEVSFDWVVHSKLRGDWHHLVLPLLPS